MKNGVAIVLCLGAICVFAPIGRANMSSPPNVPAALNTPAAPPQSDSAAAIPSDGPQQPYSGIWERNAFDLTPKVDQSALKDKDKNNGPSNIKLVGIYTIFGKRALISVQESNGPGKGAKQDYYNLSEGERRGGLELLEINPTARTIKIKNDEIVSTLGFETNNAASHGAMAGAPHPPENGFRGYQPGMPPGPATRMPMALPSRMMRGGYSSAAPPQDGIQPAGYSTGYAQPGGFSAGNVAQSGGFGQSSTGQNPQASPSNLSAEEQAALLHLQVQNFQNQFPNQGFPSLPTPGAPLPPSPGSSPDETGANGGTPNGGTPNQNLPPWLRNRTIPSFPSPH